MQSKTLPQHDRARELRHAAAELFFDRGYEATTTREIARALGIKSGSIYYHYDTKEQILFHVIHSSMEQILAGLRVMLERETTPVDQLAGIVVNHVAMHALRPKETTLGETELRSLTEGQRLEVIRMRDEYETLVVEMLERGADAGEMDVLHPKLTARALMAQSTNVGIWFRPDGALSLDEVARIYVNLALRLVGAPPADAALLSRLTRAACAYHAVVR
jgi:AcrR family transcriptional regulator